MTEWTKQFSIPLMLGGVVARALDMDYYLLCIGAANSAFILLEAMNIVC